MAGGIIGTIMSFDSPDSQIKSTKKSKLFYGYVIVIACFFIMTVYWGTTFSYGIFFDSLIKEFNWSRAATSGAYSVMTLIFGLTSLIIAKLCDKYGPRFVIGTCGLLMGIGYILLSSIHALWQLYLYYDIFIAIGMGSYISLMPVVIRWFVKRRALMIGALSSGMGLGSVIFPPLAHRLIATYQWRFSFIIFAVIITVVVLIATQFLKRDPYGVGLKPYGESETAGKGDNARGASLPQALHTRQFWLIGGMYFTYVFCQSAILIHIYIHALRLNVPSASAASIVSVYGVFQILGMNVSGYLADRYSNKMVAVASFILLTISLVWLLILARDTMTFFVFAFIMGYASGSMQIMFSPIIAEVFGLKSQGVILGAISFIASFGAASGSEVAGYIFDVNQSYTLAFIICAVLAAAGIAYASLIRPIARGKVEVS